MSPLGEKIVRRKKATTWVAQCVRELYIRFFAFPMPSTQSTVPSHATAYSLGG